MSLREKFVKGDLEKIYQHLNDCYEYCPYLMFQDDKRFLKTIEILFEINDKANCLRQVAKKVI